MKRHTQKSDQKLTVWLLIAIFGFSGAISSGNRVLCVGEDGHSQIEQAVESCCFPNVTLNQDKDSKNDNPEDSECGDCNDIEVSDMVSNNRSIVRSDCEAPPLYASISVLDSRALIHTRIFDKRDIPITSSPAVSQLVVTTTVLII